MALHAVCLIVKKAAAADILVKIQESHPAAVETTTNRSAKTMFFVIVRFCFILKSYLYMPVPKLTS